jgi:hypothetical protein
MESASGNRSATTVRRCVSIHECVCVGDIQKYSWNWLTRAARARTIMFITKRMTAILSA